MKAIPYGRQHITADDIQAVVEVLKSDYLTQGPAIVEFEEAFASYIGSKFAVAVSNSLVRQCDDQSGGACIGTTAEHNITGTG